MIKLVTGPIHSGKTTYMMEAFEGSGKIGDGLISIKVMSGSNVLRYELLRLATRESKVLMVQSEHEKVSFESHEHIGPYYVSYECINWAADVIKELISNRCKRIYLDEIGKLEFMGGGLASILNELIELLEEDRHVVNGEMDYERLLKNKMISRDMELVLSVRDENLEAFKKKFLMNKTIAMETVYIGVRHKC